MTTINYVSNFEINNINELENRFSHQNRAKAQELDSGNSPSSFDTHATKLSEVFGIHGELVDKPVEFRPALERALKSAEQGKTAVLNVRVDPTLVSPAMHQIGIQAQFGHVPWNELPKRGKAMRRFYHFMFPWSETEVPPVTAPDPWEPIGEDEMEP